MDIGTIRGIGTAVVFVAFSLFLLWAYSKKRKQEFEDAALIPFQDELETTNSKKNSSSGSNDQ